MSQKKWRWFYATSTLFSLSLSDIWAARSISLSDWLVEGKQRPDDKRDGKWTWNEFDMMSANAPRRWSVPLTSLPEMEVGLEKACSWRLQLTVTALSNHITHHNAWESACLPGVMDRWQSFLLFCILQPSPVCAWLLSCFHLYPKCNKLPLKGKTFTNVKVINDRILFLSISSFHFWPWNCTLLLIYSWRSIREAVCAGSQWALCVCDEGKGDLDIQRVCFSSVETSSRRALTRVTGKTPWQCVLILIYTTAGKNPNKLGEPNNTQQEINDINNWALNDS